MRDIFFSVQDNFLRQVFSCKIYILHRNQSARYFFSDEITHTPLKSQMVGQSVSTIFVSYFRTLSGDYFASGNIKLADLKPYWHFIRLNTASLTLLFTL